MTCSDTSTGHIYKIQGKGTFISLPKLEQSVSPYIGFKEQVRTGVDRQGLSTRIALRAQ